MFAKKKEENFKVNIDLRVHYLNKLFVNRFRKLKLRRIKKNTCREIYRHKH